VKAATSRAHRIGRDTGFRFRGIHRETEAMKDGAIGLRGLALAHRADTARRHLGIDLTHGEAWYGLLAGTRARHRLRRQRLGPSGISPVSLERPGTGVMRHADAGYDIAIAFPAIMSQFTDVELS